ncbi:MAG: phosphate-starvation-inducible PsiE family protein [Coleofasciculaceae cyanobacterium]
MGLRRTFQQLKEFSKDENFLHFLEIMEIWVSKVLSALMIVVILYATFDLIVFIFRELLASEFKDVFKSTLFKTFGLFLNILIALEILENITAYLKKHVVQVELVIVTSLIAVGRKIIILDIDKTSGLDIIGLGVAVLSLSISYWIIRSSNRKPSD